MAALSHSHNLEDYLLIHANKLYLSLVTKLRHMWDRI